MSGLDGGSGWTGAWSGSATCTIDPTGMSYTRGAAVLVAGGGRLECIGGSGSRIVATGIGSPADSAGVVDGNGNIGADGTSVWVAFLGECPASGADFGIDFTRLGAPYAQPQTGIISLGGDRQWRFWPQANQTGIPAAQKVLLVWRIDFAAAGDACSVWINPTPGTVPPDASRTLYDSGGNWSFDRISFSGGAATTLHFDELRIGTSFTDVAPLDSAPPDAPDAPLPADLAGDVAGSTSLDWSDSLGAESYDVYLWPAAGSQPAEPTTTVTTSRYDPPGYLLPFTQYAWQVAAFERSRSAVADWEYAVRALDP